MKTSARRWAAATFAPILMLLGVSTQAHAASTTVPDAPRAAATVSGATVTVKWFAPAKGGSKITGYTVTQRRYNSGEDKVVCKVTSTSCKVTNQIPGETYWYYVYATNSFGDGPSGGTDNVVVRIKPAKPTRVSAIPSDSYVDVSWPAVPGTGLTVTYKVTTVPATAGCSTTGTSCGFSVPNGKKFTAKVTAFNDLGNGGAMSSNAAYPTPPICATYKSFGLNLAGRNLRGCDVSNQNFAGADLSNARLDYTNFSNANLTGAKLVDAYAYDANFSSAKLNNANATRAQLTYGDFPSVSANAATFANADLYNTNLRSANFAGVDFTGTRLSYSYLQDSTFAGANFSSSELSNVYASNTDFSRVNLTSTSLSSCYVASITLTSAIVSGAYLNFNQNCWNGSYPTSVTSGGLAGTPEGTGYYLLTAGYLVGPGSNLAGADLASSDLTGVYGRGITVGPKSLPTGWAVIAGYLVGPGANLTYSDLHDQDLSGVALTNANLSYANLTGTTLGANDLSGAQLIGVNLSGMDLRGVKLTNVNLESANLSDSNLTDVDLSNSRFYSTHMTGVRAAGANFTSTEWNYTQASGSDFSGATFDFARAYRWTTFADANFTGASMKGFTSAYWWGGDVSFTNANLRDVDLSSSYFNYANLSGADFTGANLGGGDIFNSSVDGTDFTNATLDGIYGYGLSGTPAALPPGWTFTDGFFAKS